MKKIVFIVMAALGVVMTTTSCASLAYAQDYGSYGYGYYGYGYGTVQTTPNPNGLYVSSNHYRPTGTRVVGNQSTPIRLIWANMSVVRNGLMVYVYDGNGQIINQYDLRIPKQNIEDEYRPTGLNGKALSVSVTINGGRGFNAVIVNDGNNREVYYLS